jgi:hypothetical protein
VDFSEARYLFVIIFQIPGPNCKIMDCGLISKKPRGLNEKCRKLEFSGNCFPKGNLWTESTSPWTASDDGEPHQPQEGVAEGRTRLGDSGEQSVEEALGGVDVADSEVSN